MKFDTLVNNVRKACGYQFPRLGKFGFNLFFKFVPSRIKCELFQGIWINFNFKDSTQRATFWQGQRFEFPTAAVLKDWGGGKRFFDIGANYGFYSFLMLHQLRDVTVYAFEPNHITFRHLESTKSVNSLDRLNIFNCGLGSKREYLELHPGVDDSGHSTFLNHPEFACLSLGKIPITTFDSWTQDLDISYPYKPEWIAKIDVEGMELSVLKGMERALTSKSFKGICIEVCEHTLALNGNQPEDIFQFLDKFGYHPITREKLITKFGRISTMNVFFVPT
ncbi:MAG: FkbM family methyltransferase [Proteobacteria bacterium]|nr:FkbM family methyltransferase [Pseudomonadota bacterium]